MTKFESAAIDKAVRILESHMGYFQEPPISSPEASKQLCFLKLGDKPDEHFACAYMTNRHQLISFETLFRGTVDGASVSSACRSPQGPGAECSCGDLRA